VAFARVVETAALTGSLDTGLRTVARETPSREVLSPFLLKFREHASQGSDSLQEFLRMESRMLAHQRSRARQRASDYLELLAELLVALLVAPTLLVLAVTVASAFVPGLSRTVPVFGRPTVRTLLVSGSSTFVLLVGGCAAILTARLRPSNYGRSYERPTGIETLTTMTENPASAAFVFAFPAVAFGWLLWTLGQPIANALLLGYAAYGFPVGAVAVSREQIDDAKDREIRDFVHAVAGHVRLGKPFGAAVEAVASEIDFGPLGDDIDALAFGLGLTTGTAGMDARREALDRFVDRVGTPLAEQTVGLVTGALDVGSDAETAFETLQTEVGALYHQRKELRSAMFVYVAVGWIVALLTVGVVVAVASYVLGGAVQLPVDAPDAAGREIRQLYLLTQSTMLACGWFAGVASRGRYEALLHSSALVAICHVAFVGAGLI
jgi:archaellum biogenesis protein FlaJ (TadC family)